LVSFGGVAITVPDTKYGTAIKNAEVRNCVTAIENTSKLMREIILR
jgi:hypothetical protein